MKIRTRLAIVFAAVASILFGLSGFLVIRLLQSNLYTTIDRSLVNRAPFLDHRLSLASRGFPQPFGPSNRPITLNGSRVVPVAQLLNGKGQVIGSFGSDKKQPLLAASQIGSHGTGTIFFTATPVGIQGDYRFLVEPSPLGGGDTLVIARPISSDIQTISRVTEYFWIGWLLVTLLAGAGSYLLGRRALAPVEQIRKQAEAVDVEAETFALKLPNTGDEIEALGRTMNELLAKLHNSISDQRAFLSNASHELRTPLASLLLELELASFPGRNSEELSRSVGRALETARQMSRLTDDLFLLAVLDEQRRNSAFSVVDVSEVALDAIKLREDLAARSGVQLAFSSSGKATALVDVPQIRLAIGNLIDNAVRHSPYHAEVSISVREVNKSVVIAVTDSGPGFPPEFIPFAFERFSRPDAARDRSGGGAGLGLALVQAVVEAHAGTVEITDSSRLGATVSISLPMFGDSENTVASTSS